MVMIYIMMDAENNEIVCAFKTSKQVAKWYKELAKENDCSITDMQEKYQWEKTNLK